MKKHFFEILNDFFDHIYVVSLKRSEERHVLLKENLSGLKYEIYWGVDGKNLDQKKLESENIYHSGLTQLLRKKDGVNPKDMSLPKIGCALTKAKIYKDIVRNNYEKALILEDDILFDTSKNDYVSQALQELPDNWDLLYFGYWGNTKPIPFNQKIKNGILSYLSKYLIRYSSSDIKKRYPRHYSDHLDKSGNHFGNHSYALSLGGAKKILKYALPITHHGDTMLGELSNYEWINAFNLKQIVAYQNRLLDSTLRGPKKMQYLPSSVIDNNKLNY